ncbi:MAG: hypothetical protein HFJ09_11815 [Lachnospiraceae bacterium]|nr:hypothetical protein [Lachnospiraceae bacterium]
MNEAKQFWKDYLIRITFIFAMLGFCLLGKGAYVQAETTDGSTDKATAVQVVCIDYEKGMIQIQTNKNTKVYYSDASQKTWNVIEGAKINDILTMDISWISVAKDYELNLKGSDDETIVSIELPKYNSALKAKFDKVDGTIEFTNEEGATEFEWRKAAAIDSWSKAPIDSSKPEAQEFLKEIEKLRVKGGKIQIRIPQKIGTSEANVGSRPSKIITVSVTKRGNAPSVKVVSNSMQVNTTDKMEYKVISVGTNQQADAKWTECDKKMFLSDMVPQVITVSGSSVGQDVVVAIRKSETEKTPYTKNRYLNIPAQPGAPDASTFSTSKTSSKFSLIIGDASKYNPYQYAVVAKGDTKSDRDLKWKNVSSSKAISFSIKKYPEGSTIYVRTKGENLSKKTELKLPSAYTTISTSYLAETKE